MNADTVQQESSIIERLLVSPEAAKALLSICFSGSDEQKMRELMDKNNSGTISRPGQGPVAAQFR